jgi:hypothetical protein
MRPFEKFGMKEMREKLDAFGDSWTRARKVCVGIDGDHFGAPWRCDAPSGLNGLLESKTAWSHYHDLRRSSRDCIPRDTSRVAAELAKRVVPAR